MRNRRSDEFALLLLALLILAAFVVPYTLLRGVPAWNGAFLFWTLFGVAAVAVILWLLGRWRV